MLYGPTGLFCTAAVVKLSVIGSLFLTPVSVPVKTGFGALNSFDLLSADAESGALVTDSVPLVTATLVDSLGAPVTTLFIEQKNTGSYEFRWNAAGIVDGRYGIVLSARNALGVETTATLAVIVDRTLSGFRVAPQIFSPNRDGRLDTTRFRFNLNGPARVTLTVRRGKKTLGQVFSGPLEPGQRTIEWNGRFRRGVGEHEFRAGVSRDGRRWTWGGVWTFPAGTTPRIGLVAHGGAEPPAVASFDYLRFHARRS